jgi:hypothetical protein
MPMKYHKRPPHIFEVYVAVQPQTTMSPPKYFLKIRFISVGPSIFVDLTIFLNIDLRNRLRQRVLCAKPHKEAALA